MGFIIKISNKLNSFGKKAVKPFLPKYQVEFVMYSVVPGQPVSKNSTVYDFERGEYHQAKEFYSKTLESTKKFKILPSEVLMRKRKKIIHSTKFGPVNEIRKFRIKK